MRNVKSAVTSNSPHSYLFPRIASSSIFVIVIVASFTLSESGGLRFASLNIVLNSLALFSNLAAQAFKATFFSAFVIALGLFVKSLLLVGGERGGDRVMKDADMLELLALGASFFFSLPTRIKVAFSVLSFSGV